MLNQDLKINNQPSTIFMMHLLMKDASLMPDKTIMSEVLGKHIGAIDCFCHNQDIAGFVANNYTSEFKDAAVPPQLMITGCTSFDEFTIDELRRSQMWDCQDDKDQILSDCKFQVIATDMLGAALPYQDRANLLMDYMEALVELYPTCEAIYFETSGKLFTVDAIKQHQVPHEHRFLYFAVNVRLFNIQNSDSHVIDTLGMSTLYLPDLQYHFHGIDPNLVVNHAYQMITYIFMNDNPIKDNDTIDGIIHEHISLKQWRCHYEDSLIQPMREVLDIDMDEFASGERQYYD